MTSHTVSVIASYINRFPLVGRKNYDSILSGIVKSLGLNVDSLTIGMRVVFLLRIR
jgi:hypothetical protein